MAFIGLLFEAREELGRERPDLDKLRRLIAAAFADATGGLLEPSRARQAVEGQAGAPNAS